MKTFLLILILQSNIYTSSERTVRDLKINNGFNQVSPCAIEKIGRSWFVDVTYPLDGPDLEYYWIWRTKHGYVVQPSTQTGPCHKPMKHSKLVKVKMLERP